MNVVVTGATSFIGAVTVRQLLEQGHQVAAVVRPGSANLCQLTDPLEGKADLLERLQIVPLDLGQIRRIGDVIGETTDAAAAIAVGEPLPVADLHRLAAAGDPFPRAALRSHFAPADA
ncbi:MAG TPA: NAD-dependent epimerase/dehydratase family protein, partial [Candidatus Ventrimonas merdavium]|nr:NAD-dependent epimerase/dehydratase family protein [Candidatus Ventrimonas merdavium]